MPDLQVFMGSSSDLKVVKESGLIEILDEVIGPDNWVVHICSAHRNPDALAATVKAAVDEGGGDVFIGIAGMATALPGALAGATRSMRLVIGVPLDEHGINSCMYMPPGVPVATAGVGKIGVKQAALLACQVLVIRDEARAKRLLHYLDRTAKDPEFSIDPREDS
jgi:5-(carboxyamino)imidazole ribonucleotide mutase